MFNVLIFGVLSLRDNVEGLMSDVDVDGDGVVDGDRDGDVDADVVVDV